MWELFSRPESYPHSSQTSPENRLTYPNTPPSSTVILLTPPPAPMRAARSSAFMYSRSDEDVIGHQHCQEAQEAGVFMGATRHVGIAKKQTLVCPSECVQGDTKPILIVELGKRPGSIVNASLHTLGADVLGRGFARARNANRISHLQIVWEIFGHRRHLHPASQQDSSALVLLTNYSTISHRSLVDLADRYGVVSATNFIRTTTALHVAVCCWTVQVDISVLVAAPAFVGILRSEIRIPTSVA